jgi:hypothetical protein
MNDMMLTTISREEIVAVVDTHGEVYVPCSAEEAEQSEGGWWTVFGPVRPAPADEAPALRARAVWREAGDGFEWHVTLAVGAWSAPSCRRQDHGL